MPITKSIIPEDRMALNKKILATKPGEEGIILRDVKAHVNDRYKYEGIMPNYRQLEIQGHAIYHQAQDNVADVALMTTKCMVFLVGGKFKVGEELVTVPGEGYMVESEKTIQLQRYTVVVIIEQD